MNLKKKIGKTYTMEGSTTNRGVNYRALGELFDQARERAHGGIRMTSSNKDSDDNDDPLTGPHGSFEVLCSVLEIHNERVIDLLRADPENVKVIQF